MPVQTLATPGEPHRYQFSLSNSSDTCQIYLFGATITSWRVNGEEKLFLSSKSLLDGTKAIRGGIPLVFPQFAVPTVPHCAQLLPQHGFARDNHWKWLGTTVDDGEIVTGSFLLDDPILPKDTKALWPFKFQLTYTVTLKAGSLTTCLSAKNTDQKEWKFTSLLHNYFLVPSIETTRVHGLKGFSFYDKTDEKKKKQENRDSIHMDSEVDRIYENVTTRDLILDTGNASTKAGIKITNDNFRDVVTWNPWAEKAKAMRDMADDEYKNMICVELGTVVEPITLRPGETWKAGQVLTAI